MKGIGVSQTKKQKDLARVLEKNRRRAVCVRYPNTERFFDWDDKTRTHVPTTRSELERKRGEGYIDLLNPVVFHYELA